MGSPHRRRVLQRYGWLAFLSLGLPGLALAEERPALEAAASGLSLVAGLHWVIFVVAVLVFILVEMFLIVAALRFRRHSAEQQAAHLQGTTRMDLAWTIGPALGTALIFGLVLQAMLAG